MSTIRCVIPVTLLLLAACAPPPDYVTKQGAHVYDSHGLVDALSIDYWIDCVSDCTSADRERVQRVNDVMNDATITILRADEVEGACHSQYANGDTGGCADAAAKDILVGFFPCDSAHSTAGELAHEIGHLLGYHHDELGQGAPWYANAYTPSVARLVDHAVCD